MTLVKQTYGPVLFALVAAALLFGATELEAQWLEGYSYRKAITLDPDMVPGSDPLTGFPCLISTTDTILRTEINGGVVRFADGRDLCFTGADKLSILDYEIESFDPVDGTLHAWVRIPSLSALAETRIYLYFGGPDAQPQWDTAAVWSNQYTAVWHMNNDPSGPDPHAAGCAQGGEDRRVGLVRRAG